MAKFHEERGKIKCACWQCQGQKEMREEMKKERKEQESKENKELASCAGCDKEFRINRINEEGLCKKCEGNFAS
jgi:hypothetical protein